MLIVSPLSLALTVTFGSRAPPPLAVLSKAFILIVSEPLAPLEVIVIEFGSRKVTNSPKVESISE